MMNFIEYIRKYTRPEPRELTSFIIIRNRKDYRLTNTLNVTDMSRDDFYRTAYAYSVNFDVSFRRL